MILVFPALLEKKDSGSQLLELLPILLPRFFETKATTGLWTCGALVSSSMSHFLELFLSMKMRISTSKSRMLPSCILHILGRRYQVRPLTSSTIYFRYLSLQYFQFLICRNMIMIKNIKEDVLREGL